MAVAWIVTRMGGDTDQFRVCVGEQTKLRWSATMGA